MPLVLRAAVKLAFGLVGFVGLPLLGWGVDDLDGFFRNPARATYVAVVALLQFAVIIAMPEAGRGGGPGTKRVGRQRVALALLQLTAIALVVAAPFSDRRSIAVLPDEGILRFAGVGLYALGVIVMHRAEAVLGNQFSVDVTIQEHHQLITDGLYRHLRHPRYVGIVVFSTGLALAYRSGLALLLVAAMIVVLLWRIHDEEALMHQEFGTEWEAYARRSWRLVPFVY